jgi:hypothetical protein
MEERSWQEEELKEEQNFQFHLYQITKNNMSKHINIEGVTLTSNTFFYTQE